MGKQEKKITHSLNAFIEQTARQLRNAVKSSYLTKRELKKKSELSNSNKIEQIALLLRSEIKKLKHLKKKSR